MTMQGDVSWPTVLDRTKPQVLDDYWSTVSKR